MSRPHATILGVLLASGCIRQVGSGPFVGDCAEYPDGVYAYGQIGIGTCIAGPVDVSYIEKDGKTWLAVSNANPYLTFNSGSVLLIDWDSIDFSKAENHVSDLVAYATDAVHFPGQLGYLPDRDVLLVPDRYTPDATTNVGDDRVYVVDVADPENPALTTEGSWVTVGDDPQLVAVDAANDRAFVLNLTEHSISVLDTSQLPLSLIETALDARVLPATFAEASTTSDPIGGSQAEIDGATVVDATRLVSDRWMLTWIEGTFRLWAPDAEQGVAALDRWTTGLDGAYQRDAAVEAADVDAEALREPFIGYIGGVATMYAADEAGISSMLWNSSLHRWDRSLGRRVYTAGQAGFDAWVGAPSVVVVDGAAKLFFEVRDAVDGTPRVALATTSDGATFDGAEVVLEAPDGFVGVGAPFLRDDPLTGTLRAWVSLWDGTRWSIGHAESTDGGATWSAVQEILRDESGDIAAPVVTWVGGRYLLWASVADSSGSGWRYVSAWSADGLGWDGLSAAAVDAAPFDPLLPPRLGLEADPTSGWRVEGDNSGWLSTLATSGATYTGASGQGLNFRVASGFEVSGAVLGDSAANGLEPGSWAEIDGVPTLFVTATDGAGRASIAALQADSEGGYSVFAEDLVPTGVGGNTDGVRDPVVVRDAEGVYHLFYATTDARGVTRIRRSLSDDGVSFQPDPDDTGELVPAGTWDAVTQAPHSAFLREDGSIELWYSGSDGARSRIGSAVDDGTAFSVVGSGAENWQFETGSVGSFDGLGVEDPAYWRDGDTEHLWYSGFDGSRWRIGHAYRTVGSEEWTRSTAPGTEDPAPSLTGFPSGFAEFGVYAPVVGVPNAGGVDLWFAGSDGVEPRIGRARASGSRIFPQVRFPTAGDTLRFTSIAGTTGTAAIDLSQYVDGWTLDGTGASSLVLDAERGFLYVTSKRTNIITVIDVRDDSTDDFIDANVYDIEAVLPVRTANGPRGFRDFEPIPGTDRVYATSWNPDGLFVLDIGAVVDDDQKQSYPLEVVAALPLAYGAEDEGAATQSGVRAADDQITGGDMAVAGDLLLVPHFQDNSLSVVDLAMGANGQEIRHLAHIGENPHLVRVSPDGRRAVVANYAGVIDDRRVESNLAVVDLDPDSPTYLQVLTRITNQ